MKPDKKALSKRLKALRNRKKRKKKKKKSGSSGTRIPSLKGKSKGKSKESPKKSKSKLNLDALKGKKKEKTKKKKSKNPSTIVKELSELAKENKEKLTHYQRDLDRANRIQFNLLPDKIPKIPNLDLRVHYQSSKEVGGDYYDFITVDSEHLGIVVADVSGKGVPAAMVMAMARAFLRLLARKNISAKKTVQRLNKFLARDIRGIMFVTMIYMILNVNTRELQICNAGHNPLLLKGDSSLQIINPPGMAVGLDLGDRFNEMLQEEVITLNKDDRVLVYTDGVTEAMSEEEEEFGEEPMVDILQNHYRDGSQRFLNTLIKAIQKHQGKAQQHDDITILTFQYNK